MRYQNRLNDLKENYKQEDCEVLIAPLNPEYYLVTFFFIWVTVIIGTDNSSWTPLAVCVYHFNQVSKFSVLSLTENSICNVISISIALSFKHIQS